MKAIAAVAASAAAILSSATQAQSQTKAPDQAVAVTLTFTRIPTVPESSAIPLYPRVTGSASTEVWDKIYFGFRVVRNVTQPTLTPMLPAMGKRSGAAVVVVPGGGFTMLQMDIEGWAVARWLADHGIAAFILKYRLRPTPPDEDEFMSELNQEISRQHGSEPPAPDSDTPLATEDAISALKLVRENSAKWAIDPAHVGMIGFSAGAMTTMTAVLSAAPADRPDFFGYIYGPMDTVLVSSLYGSTDRFAPG